MSSVEDTGTSNTKDDPAAAALASSSTSLAPPTTSQIISTLRKSIRQTYPEIDHLYSDAYLASVVSVPDRTYEYARDEKISKALEWRRQYGVDSLVDAFYWCDSADDNDNDSGEGGARGIFRAKEVNNNNNDDENENESTNINQSQKQNQPVSPVFVPSQYLVDVCLSGAFRFAGFDKEGRAILHSQTALLDWWRTGVEDGIRYHVLVIEYALRMILIAGHRQHNGRDNTVLREDRETNISESKRNDRDQVQVAATNTTTAPESVGVSESMVLYVDTSNMSLIPPPMGALIGLAKLLQRAYPDRIHRIYIGPVNPVLRKLYELVAPYLRPRSRDKIVLLEGVPGISSDRG